MLPLSLSFPISLSLVESESGFKCLKRVVLLTLNTLLAVYAVYVPFLTPCIASLNLCSFTGSQIVFLSYCLGMLAVGLNGRIFC